VKARWLWLAWVVACTTETSGGATGDSADGGQGFQPPVVTNPEPPVEYPAVAFDRQIEGTVVLRLFIDESGAVAPESTRIAEGSGRSDLDSAALAGVPHMRFAPARRNGAPVATAFLQPVHFRHPERVNTGSEPP
jgi:TonB family protein